MKKIFILHGWTYSTEQWQPFVSGMSQHGFECVNLRVPGLTEETDRVWTLADYVGWLKEKLQNERDVILIGHSNGGRIALAYAAEKPHNLQQLVLIDSAGVYHRELPLQLKRFILGSLAKIGKRFSSSEKLKNVLYKVARERDYQKATPQMKLTMVNLITNDVTPLLSKIETPTLLIWGAADRMTPATDGELMQSKMKNAKLFLISGAKHSPHATHTQLVIDKVLSEIA